MLFSGAWGKMIHEKPEAKNLVTLSLSMTRPVLDKYEASRKNKLMNKPYMYVVRSTRLYSSVPLLETGTPKLFGGTQNE